MTEKTDDEMFAIINPDPKLPRQCSKLAQKVCELSLADYAFNKYPPSLTASCALRIASELLKTEQGLVEHAVTQSQEDVWNSSLDELFTRPASAQSPESRKISEGHFQTMKHHFLPVGQESYDDSLAQECKDNLKLLVSLNLEALEVMSTM